MINALEVVIQILCVPVQIFSWYMIYRAQWLYDVNRREMGRDPQCWRKKRLSWSDQYWRVFTWDADKLVKPVEDND